ncbi:MAG: IS200/IS605 family transposase [Algibacter sp.]
MANTYSQIYIHVVFAVKRRRNSISKKWKVELYKYITGIVTNKDQKLMVINGMPDHIHILLGIKPNCNLSDLVRDIKANSSKWINEKQFVNGKFEWQTGFGAFSVSQSQIKTVATYIENQEIHHAKKSFKDEYIDFLKAYSINYKDDYLFSED